MEPTTGKPLFEFKTKQQIEEEFKKLYTPQLLYSVIGYAVFYTCLILVFTALRNPYTKAFKKHSKLFRESPLLPIINHGFRVIKRVYLACFAFIVTKCLLYIYPGPGIICALSVSMVFIFLLAIRTFTSTYPLVIAIISLLISMNSRLSRTRAVWFTVFFYGFTIFKDIVLLAVKFVYFLIEYSKEYDYLRMSYDNTSKSEFDVWYQKLQQIYQAVLIFLMLCQFWFGRGQKPTSNLPEYIVIIQTKYIGLVKFLIFTVYGISALTDFQTIMAYAIFVTIDLILVPLVVQITEIRIGVVKPEGRNDQQPVDN